MSFAASTAPASHQRITDPFSLPHGHRSVSVSPHPEPILSACHHFRVTFSTVLGYFMRICSALSSPLHSSPLRSSPLLSSPLLPSPLPLSPRVHTLDKPTSALRHPSTVLPLTVEHVVAFHATASGASITDGVPKLYQLRASRHPGSTCGRGQNSTQPVSAYVAYSSVGFFSCS